jgi:hypothetical protein
VKYKICRLFILLIFASCNSEQKVNSAEANIFDNRENIFNLLKPGFSLTRIIVGTDTLEETIHIEGASLDFTYDSLFVRHSVSPTIESILESVGKDTTQSHGFTESFHWTINSDTLILENSKRFSSYFTHRKYKMTFEQKESCVNLRLSPTEDTVYFLIRCSMN